MEHPFWVESKKWVEASRLKPGDVKRLANGNHAVIENINIVQLYQPILVYNFEVADYHTYYVADIGVLVNNTCNGGYLAGDAAETAGDIAEATDNIPLFDEGKVSVQSIEQNKTVFSNANTDDMANLLVNEGYDVTVRASTQSSSGAQIIQVNNQGYGNITQMQVSPGGGRHGSNSYVKISTSDIGKIKVVTGSIADYVSDGLEKAAIIFTGGN